MIISKKYHYFYSLTFFLFLFILSQKRFILAAWTLDEAKKYLKEALEARSRVLKSSEYAIGDKKTKRAELEQINTDITFWKKEVEKLERIANGKRGLTIGYGVKS